MTYDNDLLQLQQKVALKKQLRNRGTVLLSLSPS